MEKRLDGRGLGTAYREGTPGKLSKAATGLTALGAAVLAARGGRDRVAAVAGGALITAGAVCERFAIFRAGFASAARPGDTIDPQRARIRAGETRGAAIGGPVQK